MRKDPLNSRSAKARSLEDVMHELLNHYKKIGQKNDEQSVIKSWESVMGSNIMRYTENLKISNGTLYIKLSSPALRQELSYVKEKIAKSLNNQVNKEVVKKITFI